MNYRGTVVEEMDLPGIAVNNFLRIENLSALREVALRQVAEEIGAKRVTSAEPTGSRVR